MEQVTRIGIDTSKSHFQLHGVDAAERVVLKKALTRAKMLAFFGKLPRAEIGMEACGGSHHWARELTTLGHEVVLLPPQYVKPYVKRGKNDAADAEAICEAMSRPTMRFVAVKSQEQEAIQMLVGMRAQLVNRRTQLANTIRGFAAEFGLVVPKGLSKIEPLLVRIAEDTTLPAMAREQFVELGQEYAHTDIRARRLELKLLTWQRGNEQCQRLQEIPGIGPVCSTLLVIKAPDVANFRSGRDYAAWMGLTPKNHSTAGKNRLGVITKAGDEMLRSALVVGATAIIQQITRGRRKPTPWQAAMLKRKAPKLVAVALANKMARMAFKLMTTGERYDPHYQAKQIMKAAA